MKSREKSEIKLAARRGVTQENVGTARPDATRRKSRPNHPQCICVLLSFLLKYYLIGHSFSYSVIARSITIIKLLVAAANAKASNRLRTATRPRLMTLRLNTLAPYHQLALSFLITVASSRASSGATDLIWTLDFYFLVLETQSQDG